MLASRPEALKFVYKDSFTHSNIKTDMIGRCAECTYQQSITDRGSVREPCQI